MIRKRTRRELLRDGSAATAALAGCLESLVGPSPAKRVEAHEDELKRFADVGTVLEEGYRTTGTYVRTERGAIGTPFVDPEITRLDPTRPRAVLFDLTGQGEYRPLGLKWFVPAANRDGPPTLFGREFDGPIPGRTPMVPDHYALHVWLFRENPDGLFALANPAIDPPNLLDGVATARDALEPYVLGVEAEAAGYVNTEQCVETADGVYGVPFLRAAAGERGGTDPANPPVLLYRLTSEWSYELMGAEWFVPASETSTTPTLFGQRFHDPVDGHSGKTDQPDHYGLHAWLFRANPRGMFEPLNPTVTC